MTNIAVAPAGKTGLLSSNIRKSTSIMSHETKSASELKTGDVFLHDGNNYVHIFGAYDTKTVSVWVVAFPLSHYDNGKNDSDIVFQLYHKADIVVVDKRERAHENVVQVSP